MVPTDPEIDNDVDELDSAAVAAAMGFSSFGAQAHPNKKRRFNPHADAIVGTPRDSRPPARVPMHLPAPSFVPAARPLPPASTSLPPRPTANLPLHPPHDAPLATTTNADEIDLDDDDDNDDKDEGGGAKVDVTVAIADDDDEPGPQYIDTSRPIGEIRHHGLGTLGSGGDNVESEGSLEDPAALQARIDAVVAAGNATYATTAPVPVSEALPARPQQLDGSVLSTGRLGDQHHSHPNIRLKDRHGFRPNLMPGAADGDKGEVDAAVGSELPSFDVNGGGPGYGNVSNMPRVQGDRWHQQQQPQQQHGRGQYGRGGQRDWWTGYYDPSSNENPWARLEAKLGLPSHGSWLERGHHNSRGQTY